jgi:hypothetical protein
VKQLLPTCFLTILLAFTAEATQMPVGFDTGPRIDLAFHESFANGSDYVSLFTPAPACFDAVGSQWRGEPDSLAIMHYRLPPREAQKERDRKHSQCGQK